MKRHHLLWLSMLLLSVVVHAVAALTIIHKQKTDINSGKDKGEDGIEVGFGQVGSYLEARKKLTTEKAEASKQQRLSKQQDITTPKSEPAKPTVKDEKKARPIIDVPTVELLDTPVKKKHIASMKKPELSKKNIEKETAIKATEVDPVENTNPSSKTDAHTKTSSNTNTLRATGAKSSKSAGSKKGNANQYFSELKSWLNQYKQYPPQLRKHKVQGVVTVRFTIDKTGALKKSSIKLSSGHNELDQAALQLLKNADPMPEFPTSFNRDQLTVSLPIEYALIDE